MKTNSLRYLGLLGLLGLSGIVTGNYGLFGFFGFFGFFGLPKERDDEMLRHNQNQAGLNAFIVSVVGLSSVVLLVTFIRDLETAFTFLVLSIVFLFMAQIITFVLSFNYYEKKGNVK